MTGTARRTFRSSKISAVRAARGKASALNYTLGFVSQPVIAVYDADNQPEPGALRPLVEELVRDPKLGAAVGFYRVINRRRNLLTRYSITPVNQTR